MQINENTAAVDNDFINHIAESDLSSEIIVNAMKKLFIHLGLTALIHPLVYKHEVPVGNKKIDVLFEEKVFEKVDFSDIFGDNETKKAYYIFLVKELYNTLLGEPLKFSDEEIITNWIRKCSLGEIHSVAMCLICGSRMFLSDDNDSKVLSAVANQRFSVEIIVYNRKEVFEEYTNSGGTEIKRTDRRSLTHSTH